MKIAFFTDDYLPYVHGAVTSTLNYRQALEELGHEVWIVAPQPKQKDFVENDDHVIRLSSVNSYIFDKRPVSLLYPGIARKLDQYDFDIIHTQTQFYLFAIAGMVAQRKNIPHVTTIHTLWTEMIDDYPAMITAGLIAVSIGYPFVFRKKPILPFNSPQEIRDLSQEDKANLRKTQGWRLIAAMVNQADVGLVPSQHLLDKLKNYGSTVPLIVQPNGVDVGRYRVSNVDDSPIFKEKDDRFIVCVARISAEKRQSVLVDAVARMKNKHTKLILVGEGPERKLVEQQARELGIEDRVIVTGLLPPEKVAAILRQSELFALASYRFDNQPMAILEAIASSLPVVYCDDNLREGLTSENAQLTGGTEAEHFAETFDELLDDEKRTHTMSDASVKVAQEFDRLHLAGKLLKIYQSSIDGDVARMATKPRRTQLPKVSIVIPAYNEEKVIEDCVRSCVFQTRPAYEIIVVNNMSTDSTEAIVKRLQRRYSNAKTTIRLLQQNERQGIIPARDRGFNAAKGEIIGRIDADSQIDTNWVESVQEGFRDHEVAAATGPVSYHDMPIKNVAFRADNHIRTTFDKLSKEYKFLFGSNMAIRRSAWESIKDTVCDDVEDKMHEDIDLALHLGNERYKIVYLPEMVGSMSARRIENSPKDFYDYIMRYERTYKHHNISSRSARIPIFIYLTTYFPAKFIRFAYNARNDQFSFDRFRVLLGNRRGDSKDEEIVI